MKRHNCERRRKVKKHKRLKKAAVIFLAVAFTLPVLQPTFVYAEEQNTQITDGTLKETEEAAVEGTPEQVTGESTAESAIAEEGMKFPFINPPQDLTEEHIQSMWVGDLIYLNRGFHCEVVENAGNVEIKSEEFYPFSIRFIKEGTVKIKVYETEGTGLEEVYEFNVQPAKEPYVEQLLPSVIKVGDSFDYLYTYYNSLLGRENGFDWSDLTWNEHPKYFMQGINWGGAGGTDPNTRTVKAYLPGGATKPGIFKVAAERDADKPYEVTIEEPVIQSNLPEIVKPETELNVTTSLENTSLTNMKIEDIVKQLTEKEEVLLGGLSSGYPIGYQPKMEIISGAELVERSNPDYTNTLNTSETIKFIGEGAVKFKVTYDMHSLYKNILEPSEVFGYLAPSGFPIAITEEAMYSPTATFTVNVSSETPSVPTEPGQPDDEDSKLSEEKIQEVINTINDSSDGEKISVNMGDATVVPKVILEAAKGRDIDIVLQMNGYTWTMNGREIFALNLADINLEVKFDQNVIPSEIVQELAGDNPVRQLSLTHNGDFGFKAILTMNVGTEFVNQYGNLYYYDSNGKMVFMNAGKIGEDGTVGLSFSHASEYAVVLSDKQMGQDEVVNAQPKDNVKNTRSNAVKTGDSSAAGMYLIILVACAGVACIAWRKRQLNK